MILQSWCIGNPSLVYFVESIHDNYSREATTGGYTGTIAPANTAVVVLSLVVVFVVLLVPVLLLLFSTFPALLVVVVFLLLSTSPSVVV